MDTARGATARRSTGVSIRPEVRQYALAAIIMMAAIGAWAILTGQVSYVATYGVSMNPLYHQGDLVIVVKEGSYQVGQIVAYHGTGPGQKVLHRIIGGDAASGFIFKGDNNKSIDPLRPKADQLIGQAFLHVPNGGVWLQPLLSPTGLGMLSFLFVSSGAGTRSRRDIPRGRRRKKVRAMSKGSSPLTMLLALARGAMRLPPRWRTAAALSALVALLGVALAVLGWIRPVTVKRTIGTERSLDFAYSAQVPRSAAYDDTTVDGPEVIFRKLTDHVSVRIHYIGPPGSFTVKTVLTAGSGWHTTLQTTPTQKFPGTDHLEKIDLDLTAIEQHVTAAAKATGVDPGEVSITITPTVQITRTDSYSASISLALTPTTVAFGTGSLKNESKPTTETVLRTIDLLGHPFVAAANARTRGILLILIGAIGGVITALLGQRQTAVRTRAEIERRHRALLVPVEPMASPPGKPVVNVDNFPALVKLAERYGQMILTWRRPDADDFVVRDEGITYRYRVPLDEQPTLVDIEHPNRPLSAGSHRKKAASDVS
jgi:signal peptidase I